MELNNYKEQALADKLRRMNGVNMSKDEIIKSFDKEEIDMITKSFQTLSKFNDNIEKGKAAVAGEIHTWNGKKFKKQADGKWKEVSEHGMTKEEHESSKDKHYKDYEYNDNKGKSGIANVDLRNSNEHKQIASKLDTKGYSDEEIGLGKKEQSENKESIFTGEEYQKEMKIEGYTDKKKVNIFSEPKMGVLKSQNSFGKQGGRITLIGKLAGYSDIFVAKDPEGGFSDIHASIVGFRKSIETDIEKAEGDRGGKVIGHTKSGKPIYSDVSIGNTEQRNKYTHEDHEDARATHSSEAKKYPTGDLTGSAHKRYAKHHKEMSKYLLTGKKIY